MFNIKRTTFKGFRTFWLSAVVIASFDMRIFVLCEKLDEASFNLIVFMCRECGKVKASSSSRQVVDSDTMPSFILLFKTASIVVEYTLACKDMGATQYVESLRLGA